MFFNLIMLIFAISFMGCVLMTPIVTRVASWAGAIDRPDQFRRIHRHATPRLGGLGLATGIALSIYCGSLSPQLRTWTGADVWWSQVGIVLTAGLVVLILGVIDDTRGVSPRTKLLGQSLAVVLLYAGGVRITSIALFGATIDLSSPAINLPFLGESLASISIPGFLLTLLWFLGCMNIWNLIDGMDGLASGVGLLVTCTLMLVAIYLQNVGAALLAAALAGGLAGFLLYNWHPACIFLGDCGSLLIGLLIGVIGVQGSLKGPSTVAILFPILAMGLPISDTAMAIFRRWVRHLPLSSADRRHVHHLLIGLGLNPRQAAVMLYCFSAFLCGVVLLGVALNSDFLALALGGSGCMAFLLILTSRRDELTRLTADFQERVARGRRERLAAKTTWEAIQRIELSQDPESAWIVFRETAKTLNCHRAIMTFQHDSQTVFEAESDRQSESAAPPDRGSLMSSISIQFRLNQGQGSILESSIEFWPDSDQSSDISLRFMQRLLAAMAERLDRLHQGELPGNQENSAARLEPEELNEQADWEPSTSLEPPRLGVKNSTRFGRLRWLNGPGLGR